MIDIRNTNLVVIRKNEYAVLLYNCEDSKYHTYETCNESEANITINGKGYKEYD